MAETPNPAQTTMPSNPLSGKWDLKALPLVVTSFEQSTARSNDDARITGKQKLSAIWQFIRENPKTFESEADNEKDKDATVKRKSRARVVKQSRERRTPEDIKAENEAKEGTRCLRRATKAVEPKQARGFAKTKMSLFLPKGTVEFDGGTIPIPAMPTEKAPERARPTLEKWRELSDNTFVGDLHGSKTIRDGTRHTTSMVTGKVGNRIRTEDGSIYTLGRNLEDFHSNPDYKIVEANDDFDFGICK